MNKEIEYLFLFGIKKYFVEVLDDYMKSTSYTLQDMYKGLKPEDAIKEKIKDYLGEGFYLAIGKKILEDAKNDFELINLPLNLNDITIKSDSWNVYFELNCFEKEWFKEDFEKHNNALKWEYLEKHKFFFEKCGLYDELMKNYKQQPSLFNEEELKPSTQEVKSYDEIMERRIRKKGR